MHTYTYRQTDRQTCVHTYIHTVRLPPLFPCSAPFTPRFIVDLVSLLPWDLLVDDEGDTASSGLRVVRVARFLRLLRLLRLLK